MTSRPPGIGFAISSNTVKLIARQLADEGEVSNSRRAWLGVDLRSVPQGGAMVAAVVHGGPAADAGIRPGDVIARVAGKPVPTVDDLAVALAELEPGNRVPVELHAQTGRARARDARPDPAGREQSVTRPLVRTAQNQSAMATRNTRELRRNASSGEQDGRLRPGGDRHKRLRGLGRPVTLRWGDRARRSDGRAPDANDIHLLACGLGPACLAVR